MRSDVLLFNPSPGQIADRLTILSIKLYKAHNVGAPYQHIEDEHEMCSNALKNFRMERLTEEADRKMVGLVAHLLIQNRLQWDYEDAVRHAIKVLPVSPSYEELKNIVDIARDSTQGNERRADLVQQIDALFEIAPEFKSYA